VRAHGSGAPAGTGVVSASAPGQAERVPGRVEEDPPSVAARLVVRFDRAQAQQQRLGLVQVVECEVEVDVLRRGVIGPA